MANPPLPHSYRLLRGLLYWLPRAVSIVDARGLEHIPAEGPVLLAANHTTALEGPIMFGLIGRAPLAVLAKKEWEGTLGGKIIGIAHAIYVSRGEVDRRALRELLKWLQEGGIAGIAPEGTRSPRGQLIEAREGAAYLALRSGASVVPIAIWGHQNAFDEWLHLRRPRIFVRVGRPFVLNDGSASRQERLEAGTRQIMQAIARLLPPEYRGAYAGDVTGPPEWP